MNLTQWPWYSNLTQIWSWGTTMRKMKFLRQPLQKLQPRTGTYTNKTTKTLPPPRVMMWMFQWFFFKVTSYDISMYTLENYDSYGSDYFTFLVHFLFPITDLKILNLCNVIQQITIVWPKYTSCVKLPTFRCWDLWIMVIYKL